MSVFVGRSRLSIQNDINQKARRLVPPFTLRQLFDVLTDGLIEPTAADSQRLGAVLHRMGFNNYRVREDGTRKVLWDRLPVGEGQAIKRKSQSHVDPDWADDLLSWADDQEKPFRMEDALLAGPLGDTHAGPSLKDIRTGARVLRNAGYRVDRIKADGKQAQRWHKIDDDDLQ